MSRGIYFLAFLLVSLTSMGHHSNAEFNFSLTQELEGRVSMISWRNPHVRLMLNVVGSDGTESVWDLEAQDVNSLGRRGLGPEMIQEGDIVRVAGNPSARRGNSMYVTNVLLPNGIEIKMRGNPEPRWSNELIGFDLPVVEEIRAAADEAQGIFSCLVERRVQAVSHGFTANSFGTCCSGVLGSGRSFDLKMCGGRNARCDDPCPSPSSH